MLFKECYLRDIPEIFKYNAFVVISDGANNKYGSFFSPYDFFYAWRKINSDDKELDGINSLVTMISPYIIYIIFYIICPQSDSK